jgi:histidinol-phosphate aminotransferase
MQDLTKLWSRGIAEMAPYVPGEQPQGEGWIKLNTNENPYPPSPKAVEAMAEAVHSRMPLYPDPQSMALRQVLSTRFGVPVEGTFVGNGSDEILAFAFRAYFQREGELLFPDVTYSFYPVYARFWGIPFRAVPLREDFSIAVEDYAGPCAGVIFPNPNAPTAAPLSLVGVEAMAAAHPECVVLVDEAYVDFGAESAVPLLAKYPNVLVVQTLSKSWSLAGLRVGFALGHPTLISGLERVRDSFNSYTLDRVAQVGATAALSDDSWFREITEKIVATRERFVVGLKELGFDVLPSAANFVFAAHPKLSAKELLGALREHKVLVRAFGGARLERHARITIGTDAQMDRVLEILRGL